MSPKSRAKRFSNSSDGRGRRPFPKKLGSNPGGLRTGSNRGYFSPSLRCFAKETVRKGALFRRPRNKSASFKIDPKGFDRTDDDDDEDSDALDTFHIELLANRALHTYNVYYVEQYKFLSLEKAVRKRGEPTYYYLTFTITSKNGDVVKTVQAIVRHMHHRHAFVHYVKIIPSTPST